MADERPQYQHGTGTIGGQSFHWGSGTPGRYWSVPYGDYPVTPDAPTGAWAQSVGAIPIANNIIPDPKLGRDRIGIMIHSGSAQNLDELYTQGCFRVAPSEWPGVRSEILKEAANGPLYLHVAPGGVAAFTNTKTFSQAGNDTPAANANATANTAAAFVLPPNAPPGMGNNNPLNIKYYVGAEKNYPGLIGPSSNTDQGDPQMKFGSPEAGWNAAYSLLNKKYAGGKTTPNMIIAGQGGWTPGNTQAAANVAKAAGIGPNDDIGFSDPAKAAKFMRALVTQEQGAAGKAYPDSMIAGAIGGVSPAQGTTLTSNPVTSPHTLTPPTAGAPYTPAAVAAANPPPAPQNTGNIVQQAFARPPSTAVDKDGNPVPTQSPVEKVANAVGGLAKAAGMGAQTAAAPAADSTPMLPAPQDSSGAMAQAGQQVLTAAIQAGAKPLSWSSRPYGSGLAGMQVPGMTLNQSGYYG